MNEGPDHVMGSTGISAIKYQHTGKFVDADGGYKGKNPDIYQYLFDIGGDQSNDCV